MSDHLLASLTEVLRKIPLFASLDLTHHRALIHKIHLMYYPAGHVIFREGEAADRAFFIKTGEVAISRERASGGSDELAVLAAGSFFGEMGLIEHAPRNATATAVTDVEAFFVDDATLAELATALPEADQTLFTAYLARKKA